MCGERGCWGMLTKNVNKMCSDFSCNIAFLNSFQCYRLLNNTGDMNKNKRSYTAKSTTKHMLNDRPVVSRLFCVV